MPLNCGMKSFNLQVKKDGCYLQLNITWCNTKSENYLQLGNTKYHLMKQKMYVNHFKLNLFKKRIDKNYDSTELFCLYI